MKLNVDLENVVIYISYLFIIENCRPKHQALMQIERNEKPLSKTSRKFALSFIDITVLILFFLYVLGFFVFKFHLFSFSMVKV